jgi:hypothetical protein
MKQRIVYWLGAALFVGMLCFGFVMVQFDYDSRYLSSEKSVRELLYFPSPGIIKFLSAGNELMMADYMWLRMIQYYAFHLRSDRNFEYLYPITDNLTDLDAKFMYPYTFGSLLLVHDAADTVGTLKILDKAKKNNPDRWEFPYMKGFILYVFLRRPEEALAEFIRASKLPRAWDGALRYAAYISKKQGHRQTSKMMWKQLYDSSTSKKEREIAKIYLDKIAIEEEMDRLQELADSFRRSYGRWPDSLEELVLNNLKDSIATDPMGGRYYWDEGSHKVRNTTRDEHLRKLGQY